jgi:hypothetical protein
MNNISLKDACNLQDMTINKSQEIEEYLQSQQHKDFQDEAISELTEKELETVNQYRPR